MSNPPTENLIPSLLKERSKLALNSQDVVTSPCLSICTMDEETNWCKGCFRTVDEIIAWSKSTNEQKKQNWQLILKRIEGDIW